MPRPRRRVPRFVIVLLTPFYRYSNSRSAYVLRGIGDKRGPVLTAPPPRERRKDRPPV